MRWEEVCNDPNLRDLPYRIELTAEGKIEMTPQKIKHSFFQTWITEKLNEFKKDGYAFTECAIDTTQGTKVADVVWVSEDKMYDIINKGSSSVAPEICIEVMSDSNTQKEMKIKRELYFKQGCLEFWLVDPEGGIVIYPKKGDIGKSSLFPTFPLKIDSKYTKVN